MSDNVVSSGEVLRRYEMGERVFRDLEVEDPPGEAPLRGETLDGIDFTGSFLVVDFTGASLQGAVFRANVKTCAFDRCDLTEADFRGAALDAATFRGATLRGARFEGAHTHGYSFGADEPPDVD